MRPRTASEIENELIEEETRAAHGNLSRVARALGIPYQELVSRLNRPEPAPQHFLPAEEPADIRMLGRPGFERFVIAVKRAGRHWPDKYEGVLEDARRKYDAGTHEMFQAPNDGWVVQYLIPRRSPTAPRRFFRQLPICMTQR
jgi:hypothetical protein